VRRRSGSRTPAALTAPSSPAAPTSNAGEGQPAAAKASATAVARRSDRLWLASAPPRASASPSTFTLLILQPCSWVAVSPIACRAGSVSRASPSAK
jgi:hypothetical protein